MNKLLVAALGGLLLVAGCQQDRDEDMRDDGTRYENVQHRDMGSMTKPSTQESMTDDCKMCPGNQKANADGTCPECHMKVKGT